MVVKKRFHYMEYFWLLIPRYGIIIGRKEYTMTKGLTINTEKLRSEMANDRVGARIAREIGVRPSYLYRKLGGEIAMSLDDLNQICKLYGRDSIEFIAEIEL
jgi:transcriptional regulator with XRE-family HTH domain